MLRISRIASDDSGATLKVEGTLRGPWVAELARVCDEPPCPLERLNLDLSAVTFVDGAGVKLLRGLVGRGARLASCSGLVAELMSEDGR